MKHSRTIRHRASVLIQSAEDLFSSTLTAKVSNVQSIHGGHVLLLGGGRINQRSVYLFGYSDNNDDQSVA